MISSCIEKYGLFLINQQGANSSVAEVSLNSLFIQSCNKLFSIHCYILIVCEQKCICFLYFRNTHHKYCHSISFAHNIEFYTLQNRLAATSSQQPQQWKWHDCYPKQKFFWVFFYPILQNIWLLSLERNLLWLSFRALTSDLCSPFLLHPSQAVTKNPKPLLGADPSASTCENMSRAPLLPCCSFSFIGAGLAEFLFRRCKHLWLKAKCDFGYCPQDFLHFPPFPIPGILPCSFPCCIFKACSSQRDPNDSLLLKCYGFSFKLPGGGGI